MTTLDFVGKNSQCLLMAQNQIVLYVMEKLEMIRYMSVPFLRFVIDIIAFVVSFLLSEKCFLSMLWVAVRLAYVGFRHGILLHAYVSLLFPVICQECIVQLQGPLLMIFCICDLGTLVHPSL